MSLLWTKESWSSVDTFRVNLCILNPPPTIVHVKSVLSSRFWGLNTIYFDTMLDYSEITVHKYIIYEDEPWEVIGSHFFL